MLNIKAKRVSLFTSYVLYHFDENMTWHEHSQFGRD